MRALLYPLLSLSLTLACGDDPPLGAPGDNTNTPQGAGGSGQPGGGTAGTAGQAPGGAAGSAGSGDAAGSAGGPFAGAAGASAGGAAGASTGGAAGADLAGGAGATPAGGAGPTGGFGSAGPAGSAGAAGVSPLGGFGGAGPGGTSGAGGSGELPDLDPQCNPGIPWNPIPSGNEKILPSNDFGALKEDRSLADLTPDTLTIAWFTPETIYYADRASTADKFTASSKLPASLSAVGYPAPDKVALSPDRRRMIVVNVERTRLAELSRPSASDPFNDTPLELPFDAIHGALQPGEYLGEPVLSQDDRSLYLAVYKGDNSSKIALATRAAAGDPWQWGGYLGDPALDSAPGPRKRLWWVSADQLTFFFFDPADGESKAAWRGNVGKPVTKTKAIGKDILTPTGAPTCLDVYYTAKNADGLLDVFHVTGI